jgi:hypothetical protein
MLGRRLVHAQLRRGGVTRLQHTMSVIVTAAKALERENTIAAAEHLAQVLEASIVDLADGEDLSPMLDQQRLSVRVLSEDWLKLFSKWHGEQVDEIANTELTQARKIAAQAAAFLLASPIAKA